MPVCTSSAIKMPPYFRTISVTILKYSFGGVMNPPTPWIGSAISAATLPRGGGPDHLLDILRALHFAGRIFETERAAIAISVNRMDDAGLRRPELPRAPGRSDPSCADERP